MKRCPSCMKIIEDDLEKCPYCGYNVSASKELTFFLPPGTILNNRYYIGKVLGSGGFGITYIAHDIRLDRTVAIKEYFPTGLATRSLDGSTVQTYSGEYGSQFHAGLERFISEARRLAEFGNVPGIVQIHDCIYANGTGYIIMDYLNGSTVKALVRKRGTFKFRESCSIILPVLDALKVVHSHGIIHRDVAPDNIFITHKGEVYLIDFGASHYSSAGDEKTISIILKHGYAPEEQYRSHANLGPWTDLYSLCATQYYMVTGKKPASANERLLEDSLVPPSSQNPSISPEEDAFILKGMSVRAGDRYQNADEMRTALNTCLRAGSSTESTVKIPRPAPPKKPESPLKEEKTVTIRKDHPVEDNKGNGKKTSSDVVTPVRKHRIPAALFIIPVILLAAAGAYIFIHQKPELPIRKGTEVSCQVSHVHADGSVTNDEQTLKIKSGITITPSPQEGETYAAVSVLCGHPSVTAEEASGNVSVTASSLYPEVRLRYYYQDNAHEPGRESFWLGIVADASGSMGFPFSSLEPVTVSDEFSADQTLTPEEVSKILDSTLTDNTSLSYNGYRYYLKTQEERDEYAALGYWEGDTGSPVVIDGQKTYPALSSDGTTIGIMDKNGSASPGWYFLNSTSISASSALSSSKLFSGEGPIVFQTDEDGHLCCTYQWRTGLDSRTSLLYMRQDDNPVRAELFQDLEASIVLEAEKQFESPMFSLVRFNNSSFDSDALAVLDWTSIPSSAIGALNLTRSDGTTAGEEQKDGNYLYNFSLQAGTSTRTGLLAFTRRMEPLTNSAEKRVVLIIGDGADTDALGTEEDSYGYSAMDYAEALKSRGYTIASIFIRSTNGTDPNAEAVLKDLASEDADGEPLYFLLDDQDHSSVAALAEDFIRAVKE